LKSALLNELEAMPFAITYLNILTVVNENGLRYAFYTNLSAWECGDYRNSQGCDAKP